MLAALLNIPKDYAEWSHFSFHNQDSHHLIAKALGQKGTPIPDFLLDPIPMNNFLFWAEQHQAAHEAFNGILGLGGSDLTDLDLNRPDQVSSWMRLHFNEHLLASQKLGING